MILITTLFGAATIISMIDFIPVYSKEKSYCTTDIQFPICFDDKKTCNVWEREPSKCIKG